jgi:hypothetical protein
VVSVLIEDTGDQVLARGQRTEGEPTAGIGDTPIREAVGQQRGYDEGTRGGPAGAPVDYLALECRLRTGCASAESEDRTLNGPVVPEIGYTG